MLDQHRAPIYDALLRYRDARVVPFDVPGHKGGRGTKELTDFLGLSCLKADVNSMKPLDNETMLKLNIQLMELQNMMMTATLPIQSYSHLPLGEFTHF